MLSFNEWLALSPCDRRRVSPDPVEDSRFDGHKNIRPARRERSFADRWKNRKISGPDAQKRASNDHD